MRVRVLARDNTVLVVPRLVSIGDLVLRGFAVGVVEAAAARTR